MLTGETRSVDLAYHPPRQLIGNLSSTTVSFSATLLIFFDAVTGTKVTGIM